MKNLSQPPDLQSEQLQSDESYQEQKFRYGFRISELGFLIPEGAHGALIENANIFPIPNTIFWLKGLVNVRGNMVPVFDLGRMLDADIVPSNKSIMVIDIEKRSIAFIIDSGQSLNESTLSLTKTTIPKQFDEFTEKVYLAQQIPWIEFNFIRCLNQFEKQISV